jgi:lipopolysaccharide/colanic/teichoic acid biosynthesis glycosyltransferase
LKRLFDLSLLIITLPFWGSVILICYILNVAFEGFPGFYSSLRYIGNGTSITVHKFRVMKKKIDKELNRSNVAIDDQIFFNLPINKNIYTNFGIKLERLGITELPQFFSVLKGDMSIVGARPLPSDVFSALNAKFPNIAKKRYDSKAGLTGLPQLVGRDALSDDERLSLEASYCAWALSTYSCLVDFKILFYTVLIVLGFKNKTSIDEALNFLK